MAEEQDGEREEGGKFEMVLYDKYSPFCDQLRLPKRIFTLRGVDLLLLQVCFLFVFVFFFLLNKNRNRT